VSASSWRCATASTTPSRIAWRARFVARSPSRNTTSSMPPASPRPFGTSSPTRCAPDWSRRCERASRNRSRRAWPRRWTPRLLSSIH